MDLGPRAALARVARAAISRGAPPLIAALAIVALAIGLWWRDCIVLAGAGLLGAASFRARMHTCAPWSGLAAGLRCGIAGAGMLTAGLMLLGWIAAVHLEAWSAGGTHAHGVLALAGIAVIVYLAVLGATGAASSERAGAVGAGLAAVLAAEVADAGTSFAACGFAGLAALVLVSHGWRLLGQTMPALLRSEQRW